MIPCLYLIYPLDHIGKISCWYLYWNCVKNRASFIWVLGWCSRFLAGAFKGQTVSLKCPVNIIVVTVSRMGVLQLRTWRMSTVYDSWLVTQDHPWSQSCPWLTSRITDWKFHCDYPFLTDKHRWVLYHGIQMGQILCLHSSKYMK